MPPRRTPAATAVSGPETLSPGSMRRRVGAAPLVRSHPLLVLSYVRLHIDDPTNGVPSADALASIEAGGNLDQFLGPDAIQIDLAGVRRLRLDTRAAALMIEYAVTGGTKSVMIAFALAADAEALFSKIWRRVGEDEFELRNHKPDKVKIARVPLAVGAGLVTVGCGLAASGFVSWFAGLGLAVAGIAAAGAWASALLSNVPVRLELARKK